jgi:hypothetical protein
MDSKESHVRRLRVVRGMLAAFFLFCLLASGLCSVAPGPAQAQQAAGYSDNFDDGQAQGWDFAWWGGKAASGR